MHKKYFYIAGLSTAILINSDAWSEVGDRTNPIIGQHKKICPTPDELKKLLNDRLSEHDLSDSGTLFTKGETLQNINKHTWKINDYSLTNAHRMTNGITCLTKLKNIEQNRMHSKGGKCVYMLAFLGSKALDTSIYVPVCRFSLEIEKQ